MKKAMKTAAALMSVVMMLGTCAVPAFAGELTKEELIQKYAPDGAYQEKDIYLCPGEFPSITAEGSVELEHLYVQELEDSGISVDEQIEALKAKFYDIPGGRVSLFNDYRRGILDKNNVSWYVNAEFENGFWYVLQEDGTASIVGADQDWVEENGLTVLQIPAEIGGAAVIKIEDNAFAYQTRFNHGIKEIVIPDTVEIIGDGAFNSAMLGRDCKINLPQNVKYIGRLAYFGTMKNLMNEFYVITIPESVEFIGCRAFDTLEGVFGRDGALRCESPLFYYSDASFILDMPESLVYCETDFIRNIDNRLSEETVAEQQKIFEELGITYNYNDRVMSFEEKTKAESDPKLKAICEAFMAEYDTDRMPRDVYSTLVNYDRAAMFLYNEYNVVTLDDVNDYYYKRAAKPAASARLAGDADCSGTVDVSDAVLTARFVAEDAGAKITDAGLQNADADGDGA
ncbi:MAG: leucine-rich repeat protein, partial [Oscillospiraceae bacterium]|nr:leucine-rich repeat protein [Oscillospiraceae bacterium]MBR4200445.1 leucine-rich repeat protein [Oscillospiraceae bacterium]